MAIEKTPFMEKPKKEVEKEAVKIEQKKAPEKEVILTPEQVAAQKEFLTQLEEGWVDDALEIQEKFSLSKEFISSPEVQQAGQKGFLTWLEEGGWIVDALEFQEKFPLPKEFIQQASQKKFLTRLGEGWIDGALEIQEEFSLKITPQEIINKFPDINNILLKLKEISPDFYNQAQKSVKVLLTLFEFRKKRRSF